MDVSHPVHVAEKFVERMPGHHKKVDPERLPGPEKISLVGTHQQRLGVYPRKKDIPHNPTSNISLVQVLPVCPVLLVCLECLVLQLFLLRQTLQSFLLLQVPQLIRLLQVSQVRLVGQALPFPLREVPLVSATPWIDCSQST